MTAQYAGEHLGRTRIEKRQDAHRFVDELSHHQSPDRYEWWLLVVGSMSPSSRKTVLSEITASGAAIGKFRRRDRKARIATQEHLPPITWKERLGILGFLVFLPLQLPVLLIGYVARLIGRGPRSYLLHAPILPPDKDPPGGAHVREPIRPNPTGGSGALSSTNHSRAEVERF